MPSFALRLLPRVSSLYRGVLPLMPVAGSCRTWGTARLPAFPGVIFVPHPSSWIVPHRLGGGTPV